MMNYSNLGFGHRSHDEKKNETTILGNTYRLSTCGLKSSITLTESITTNGAKNGARAGAFKLVRCLLPSCFVHSAGNLSRAPTVGINRGHPQAPSLHD